MVIGDQLAGALIAGHIIECSAFVTGGYYSRFKDLMKSGQHLNLGFPIAEVECTGECVIAKEEVRFGIQQHPLHFLFYSLEAHKPSEYGRHCKHRNRNLSTRLRNLRSPLLQFRRGCPPLLRPLDPRIPQPRPRVRNNRLASASDYPGRYHSSWRLSGRMALLSRGIGYGR